MGPLRRHSVQPPWFAYVEALGIAVLALATGRLLGDRLSPANVALLLMLAVVFVGLRRGLWPALVTSALCASGVSFFHADPAFSFRVERVEDEVTLACFLVASILTGSLAARLRHQLATSSALAERNERLYAASHLVAGAAREEELVASLRRSVGSALQAECVILIAREDGALVSIDPSEPVLDAEALADAGWCSTRIADDPTVGSRPGAWMFLRMDGENGLLGVLGIRRPQTSRPLEAGQRTLLLALRDLGAAAIDRRRLADRMQRAEMSAETDKLRAALLSSVSHDLRTPLSSIIGAASTLVGLGKSLDDDDRNELLSTILCEAERLDRFVGNLIDMTRIESGGPQPRPSWCDLRDIVAEALRGLSQELADRKLELRIARDFPPLHLDGFLLERVLANLLDNASKYSDDGTPIAVTAHREGNVAVVQVIDQGRGIPPSEREAVFDLFHRVRQVDKRAPGTGLGLAICRGLTGALHGSIEIQTGPDGSGTCVELRLPLGPAKAGPEAP